MTGIFSKRGAQPRGWSIAAIAFTGGVGGGVVFPILPVLGIDLGIPAFMVGLILSANRLTRLGFNPVTGSLIDRFGARWPVAAGLCVEALGTLAFSIALTSHRPSLWFLAGRIVWGVGSSLLLVGTLAAVMSIAPLERRGSMVARVRTAISLGLPAGLLIGGLIADRFSANAAFLTATALTIVGAAASVYVLPSRARREPAVPANPASTAALPLETVNWRTLLHIPDLRMIWSANALLFFAMSGVLLATLAVMVQKRALDIFGMQAQGSAGLYMAVMMVARAVTAMASGHLLDRSRSRTSLLLPAVLMVAGGFMILGSAAHVGTVVLGLLLVGAGSGALTIPLLTLLSDVTPHHLYGRALSVYQWSSDFGGAAGPIAGLELGQAFGYDLVYVAVGAILLVMALPLRALIARHR
ncbi:MAG: MFS transporter [Gammaproteobacteria bacterium]|nr:MFS transporter [Gammaproteobacteria bacterium]